MAFGDEKREVILVKGMLEAEYGPIEQVDKVARLLTRVYVMEQNMCNRLGSPSPE